MWHNLIRGIERGMIMATQPDSKVLLLQSLYDLMREQPYEQITVRAIATHCGLSQRTFYNHFRDKHDMVEWSYLHVLEEYYDAHREHMSFTDWYRVSAETVWDQRFALRKITRYQGQNALRLSVHDPYAETIFRIIREVYGDPVTEDVRLAVNFMVGGMIRYVEEAVSRKEPPTVDQAVYLFRLCTPDCLRKYL